MQYHTDVVLDITYAAGMDETYSTMLMMMMDVLTFLTMMMILIMILMMILMMVGAGTR